MCRLVDRYGYGDANFSRTVIQGYRDAQIPLDTFVSDSQYMQADQDFTLSTGYPLHELQVHARSACPSIISLPCYLSVVLPL